MNLKKILSFIPHVIFFLIGGLTVLVLSYRFGWILLSGPIYWGNDLPFALSYIYYLDRWWPYLPLWHYEWTGGMPFLQNYPLLITYLTFFIHQILDLGIVQVARFLFWLSIPLSGIGIVIFTRLVLKNWLMAILAGAFFVLSPDSWFWIMRGGFYAVATAFPLLVATFIFFELASQRSGRFFWIFAIVFFSLTWLAHPQMGATLTVGLLIYDLRKVSRPVLISVVGFLLIAFWLIPFYLSRAEGIVAPHQINYLTIKEFLGLAPARDEVYITSTFFNASLLFLASLGIIFTLVKRSLVAGKLVAVALGGIFLLLAPGIFPWLLAKGLLPFWMAITGRVVALPRLFLPMVAAFGAVSLGQSILGKNFGQRIIGQIIGGAITLITVWLVFSRLIIIPPGFQGRFFYQGFGPVYGWPAVYQFQDQWLIVGENLPLFPSIAESLKRLLTFNLQIDDVQLEREELVAEVIKKLDLRETDRVDISSGTIVGLWNTVSGVSQTTNYVQSSLIQSWLGYQQGCFYNHGIFCFPQEVQNLAKWWGTKLVYLGDSKEGGGVLGLEEKSLTNLNLAGFKPVVVELANKGRVLVYEIPKPTGLASISNKPLVLAIGSSPSGEGGLITLFRSLNRINFSYDRMILVQGKRFVDDYTLEELKKYPLIIFYGYRTHDKNKAWGMLSSYVKGGGSLFVDTGWQYFSEDWGKISGDESLEIDLPEPLPVSKSKWGNIGTKWSEPSGNNWGDLTFEGKPWGMAMAEPQNLREFGKALITTSGKIVLASGELGKGKVVWSGMNLFSHTNYYQSESENKFFQNLFSWLLPKAENEEKPLAFARLNPDQVLIKIDQTVEGEGKLMFKEVMAPGWKAFIETRGVKKELPIKKAGVGWKLIVLPKEYQGNLILSYGRTASSWLAVFISLLAGLGLVVYGLKGDFFTARVKSLWAGFSSNES